MENTTALLWRQEAALTQRNVFVVEADDPALASLPAKSLVLHSDWATVPAQQYSTRPVEIGRASCRERMKMCARNRGEKDGVSHKESRSRFGSTRECTRAHTHYHQADKTLT